METLKQRYHLESALIRQKQSLQETEEKIPAARYDLRQRQQEQTLYEGSLKHLLHRFTGKVAEETERLALGVSSARTVLENLLRLKDSLNQDIAELTAELETLPLWETLLPEEDPGRRKLWAELESKLCAETLLPLLEKLDLALEDYRSQLRGEKMGEIATAERVHETSTAHIGWAKQCIPLLQRLKRAREILEQPFEPGGYFENPEGYIVSAAAKHNRLNRVNQALEQVLTLRREVESLL